MYHVTPEAADNPYQRRWPRPQQPRHPFLDSPGETVLKQIYFNTRHDI